MAQTGYTPISIYYSSTAAATPTAGNLVAGELAINTADGKLFYKDSAGVVQVIGTKGGVGSSTTTQVLYNSGGLVVGSANLTFNGTTLTANTIGAFTLSGTIAGGGNQINNVIIGASTPLAGSFTTLSASGVATFSAGTVSAPAITTTGDTNTGIFFPAADTVAFSEGGTEAMRIDSSGNVGIGTTSPSTYAAKLVATNTTTSTNVSLVNTSGVSNTNTVSTDYYLPDNSTGLSKVATIGVDNPSATGNRYGNIYFSTSSIGEPTERMRIASGGEVLVGTTSTWFGRGMIVENGSDALACIGNAVGGYPLSIQNTATSGNNIFVGFWTDARGLPSARGTIDYNRAAGQVRYNTTSDATLKNLIGDSDKQKSVDILNSTKIREYTWKEDAEQKPQIGVIAQELYETFKGAVSVGGNVEKTDEEGNLTTEYKSWGVDKTAFTFHLIAGWQEHQKLIQELNAKVEALEAKLAAK